MHAKVSGGFYTKMPQPQRKNKDLPQEQKPSSRRPDVSPTI
jgi:hypothetical protein